MTITVAATVELDFVPPRVRLNVTASAGETSTTITRQDPDGRIVPVRTATGDPLTISSGTGLIYDYEAPYGRQVWYSSLEGSTPVQVTVDETRPWLIHPGVPVLSRPIAVAEFGSRVRAVSRAVYRPMGRATAVVHTDGQRKAPESTVQLRVETLAELADLESLTQDSSPLLLNIPTGLGWGIDPCYISVGDVEEARLMDYAPETRRYLTLPYTVVSRPAGGSQATRTLSDLLIDFGSLNDIKASFSTLLDVLAGP